MEAALAALKSAERPLVIVGKGAAYADAAHEVREFIEATQLPYLASPMGKGVLPDDHPLSTAPARSHVLQNADLVFLMGARLNWIMHFGLPPRFNPDVRVIQIDIAAEEIGTNVPAEVALVGDAKAVTAQLNAALREQPWQFGAENTWRTGIAKKIEENGATTQAMLDDDSVPMGYYRVLRDIRDALPRDAIICSEGASTMDIGRTVLPNFEPRHRLDAGSFGTMGVGLAFAIAAQAVHPGQARRRGRGRLGVRLQRHGGRGRLPLRHADHVHHPQQQRHRRRAERRSTRTRIFPTSYVPNARYEKVIEAFGGDGYFVETPDELKPALDEAMASGRPNVVNVMISAAVAAEAAAVRVAHPLRTWRRPACTVRRPPPLWRAAAIDVRNPRTIPAKASLRSTQGRCPAPWMTSSRASGSASTSDCTADTGRGSPSPLITSAGTSSRRQRSVMTRSSRAVCSALSSELTS